MKKREQIIVSLTTFPARIGFVAQTIKSILTGSRLPDKIVLYLIESEFPDRRVPDELKNLPLLEIRWREHNPNLKPYNKLFWALQDFPDAVIITIDDDIIYPRDELAVLLRAHRRHLNAICGRRVRRVFGTRTANWKLYRWARFVLWGTRPRIGNIATGVGGTLYPVDCFHKDVLRDDIFMDLAPTTDDLWWWAMAVMNGTKTSAASRSLHLDYVPGSQTQGLFHVNCGAVDQNQINFDRLCARYPIKEKLSL